MSQKEDEKPHPDSPLKPKPNEPVPEPNDLPGIPPKR
jgi:hypothetical protein